MVYSVIPLPSAPLLLWLLLLLRPSRRLFFQPLPGLSLLWRPFPRLFFQPLPGQPVPRLFFLPLPGLLLPGQPAYRPVTGKQQSIAANAVRPCDSFRNSPLPRISAVFPALLLLKVKLEFISKINAALHAALTVVNQMNEVPVAAVLCIVLDETTI